MLTAGPGKKVGIYVVEDQHYHGSASYAAILDFFSSTVCQAQP